MDDRMARRLECTYKYMFDTISADRQAENQKLNRWANENNDWPIPDEKTVGIFNCIHCIDKTKLENQYRVLSDK